MEEMEKQEGHEGCRAEHSREASAKATTRSSTEAGREETLMAALAVMKGKKPEKKNLPNRTVISFLDIISGPRTSQVQT